LFDTNVTREIKEIQYTMLFKIKHITHYKYSSEIFLEPHLLRVVPRTDAHQILKTFDLEISPLPTTKNDKIGLNNLQDYMLWFDGLTAELKITTTALVEISNPNPFNFLVYPFTATQLPTQYPDLIQAQVTPYLPPLTKDEQVKKMARELMLDIDFQTLPFVTHLTRYLCKNFKSEAVRPNSPPMLPEQTLERRAGSHKDLAYLQMALFREAGLATRYVNGYYLDDEDGKYLHAWVEVYLQGAGWKGFDPTTGMAVGERHIALTAAHHPTLTNLVTGTFRGNAHSELETSIHIQQIFS
jgi:transglutaminase-like putative cysteine protease